jgi:hypothetical protein
MNLITLNFVVWLFVQGFPSNATLFQQLFTILFKLSATCFGRTTIFRLEDVCSG